MRKGNLFRLLFVFMVSVFLFAACDDSQSKRPVILVPGWAGTEAFLYDSIHYFWNLKKPMEEEGFTVNEAPLSCFGTPAVRSKQLAAYMYLLLQKDINENNVSDPGDIKFNMISHSHGGLVARYLIRAINIPDPRYELPGAPAYDYNNITYEMIDSLKDYMTDDMDLEGTEGADPAPGVPKIAASEFVGAIAMLSVPNQGTYIAKWIVEDAPNPLPAAAAWIFENVWSGALAGQDNAEFAAATSSMTEEYVCNVFNPTLLTTGRKTPGIKIFNYSYRVYGAQLNINGMIILPFWAINYFGEFDGKIFNSNDGVVITESAAWTPSEEDQDGNSPWTYMGNNVGYDPNPFQLIKPGVDHWMLVNHMINLETSSLGIDMTPDFDTPQLYINIANMLQEETKDR